jgi:hypothetical protein
MPVHVARQSALDLLRTASSAGNELVRRACIDRFQQCGEDRAEMMIILLLISFTIADKHFERRETVVDLDLCWIRAKNEMAAIRATHGKDVSRIVVGCMIDDGTPL